MSDLESDYIAHQSGRDNMRESIKDEIKEIDEFLRKTKYTTTLRTVKDFYRMTMDTDQENFSKWIDEKINHQLAEELIKKTTVAIETDTDIDNQGYVIHRANVYVLSVEEMNDIRMKLKKLIE
jgi:hypothetical protein